MLTRIDRSRDGLAADAALYLLSAAFALVTGLSSTLLPHRGWGLIAVWGYLAAFIAVAAGLIRTGRPVKQTHDPATPASGRATSASDPAAARSRLVPARMALTWIAWAATALLPLVIEAVQRAGGRTDRAQDEVLVVEQMGERLLHTGTPYVGPAAITALPPGARLGAYAPYQPGMALFGLPRALAGAAWWTDARVWFAVVTLAALVMAVRTLGVTPASVRALQAATVFPICALTLATGGDDLPVLAWCLLALACCAAGRFGFAGLAVGAAASAKLFAFPVVAVLAVLAVVSGRGRRFLPGAIGLPILVLISPLLVDARALVENVVRFPLGHGLVQSPAQSPFPGYLIATWLPAGRYLAAGLLAAVALALAVVLLRRPPRSARSAALFCGYGLLGAILLMPSARFGYLLYPIAVLVWSPAAEVPVKSPNPGRDPTLYRV